MKVAVTGGAGYIGSVACHRLAEISADVLAIDNLSQGHIESLPQTASFANVDITDAQGLSRELQAFNPDAVLHFAALTIAPDSVRDPAPYWRVNTSGTLALLEAMRAADVRRLVFSSTAAVYGAPATVPVREEAPLAPINPYGASKLAAERAIASFADAYGMSYVALRYFNVSGATIRVGEDHRPETHLLPTVIDAAAGRRGPVSVFGRDFPTPDGTAIRDYVHVEDLIDAHLLALQRLIDDGSSLGAINLGTRHGASVQEVVSAVERLTGKKVPVKNAPRRPGDPAVLIADSSRALSVLDWEPRRSTLEEMISSTWQWRQRFPSGYGEKSGPE